jgi:hypothetical protein
MHTLQKLSSPTNHRAIFGINIRIKSIVPAIDAAMAPNSPTTLRKSINPPQTPSPRCTTPPRNKVDDEGYVHRSAPCHLHPVAAPKTMPPLGRATSRMPPSPDLERSRVSPGAARARRRGLLGRCLQQGDDAYMPPSSAMTRVGARFSPAVAPPRLAVVWSSTELCRSAPQKPPTASPYGQKPQRRRISAGAKDPRPAATAPASARTRGSLPPPPARGRRPDHRCHESPWLRPSRPASPPPQPPPPKHRLAPEVRRHRGRRQRR